MATIEDTDPAVQQATHDTLQSDNRKDPYLGGGLNVLHWAVQGAYQIPPWWSEGRDVELRRFWKKSDHLAGALYTMQSKMTSIPFKIVPKDMSNMRWVRQAEERHRSLMFHSEFGQGWQAFYTKFLEDHLSQDKGAFAEIIAPGDPAGAITGAPIALSHLDASRCQLTGNPIYPVLYRDSDGKVYKLHYSRVIHVPQMPSPIREMNGVGFSAVSRCVSVAQTLIDILVFKQEKLGSRPHSGILVTQGGLDPSDVTRAFQMADSTMDGMGLKRHSKVTVVGERSLTDADLKLIELSGLPDGFDEQTSIALGMATISLAFGVDARELFPSMQSGATRADALLAHIKQRGKGPGQIISSMEHAINFKFLPPHLEIVFEFQDDAEDRQAAEIHATRSQARQRNLESHLTTMRTERQQMLANGEFTDEQFTIAELADGRLQDGSDVLTLLYKTGTGHDDLLNFGVAEPDNILENDAQTMLPMILSKLSGARRAVANTTSNRERLFLLQVQAALEKLYDMYATGSIGGEATDGGGGAPELENRLRRENLAAPNPEEELSDDDSLRPNSDDEVRAKARAYLDQMDAVTRKLADVDAQLKHTPEEASVVEQVQRNWLKDLGRSKRDKRQTLPAPHVNITTPPVNVTVNLPEERKEFSVNLPEQPAPHVTVENRVDVPQQPAPKVDVHVDVPETKQVAPQVVVNVPEQAAPQVVVENKVEFPNRAKETIDIVRDDQGRILGAVSETEFEDD